jgi:hypothetical protein
MKEILVSIVVVLSYFLDNGQEAPLHPVIESVTVRVYVEKEKDGSNNRKDDSIDRSNAGTCCGLPCFECTPGTGSLERKL